MAWAARTGFTVVRVLAMNRGWMDLAPADGRRALPRTLAMARAHGLHVQVVALAGTGAPDVQQRRVPARSRCAPSPQACAAADNCVLELANEPYHGSQAALDDPARMRGCSGDVPADLPVAWGAARDYRSDDMAGGCVRGRARRPKRRSLGRVSAECRTWASSRGAPASSSSTASPSARPRCHNRRRRDNEPAAFFAQGLLARIFDVGTTFHCEDCLLARVPGPVQQRCAEAFIAGATLAPAGSAFTPVAVGRPGCAGRTRSGRLSPTGPRLCGRGRVGRAGPGARRVQAATADLATLVGPTDARVAMARAARLARREDSMKAVTPRDSCLVPPGVVLR